MENKEKQVWEELESDVYHLERILHDGMEAMEVIQSRIDWIKKKVERRA